LNKNKQSRNEKSDRLVYSLLHFSIGPKTSSSKDKPDCVSRYPASGVREESAAFTTTGRSRNGEIVGRRRSLFSSWRKVAIATCCKLLPVALLQVSPRGGNLAEGGPLAAVGGPLENTQKKVKGVFECRFLNQILKSAGNTPKNARKQQPTENQKNTVYRNIS